MHFSKNERVHGKLHRALAIALSVIMLVSMLYAGEAIQLEASAAAESDCYIFFDFGSGGMGHLQWTQDGARPAVWWWSEDAAHPQMGKLAYLESFLSEKDSNGTITKAIYALRVPAGEYCDHVKVLRLKQGETATNLNDWPTDLILTEGPELEVNSNRIYWVNYNKNPEEGENAIQKGDYQRDFDISTKSIISTDPMEAAYLGAENGTMDPENPNKPVELLPVDAVFYDYMTDYELINGWRSQNTDPQTSRLWSNRIPYKAFNSYISGIAAGDPAWNYPLYFGNFTSHWSSLDNDLHETYGDSTYKDYSHTFDDFYYGRLVDINMVDGEGKIRLPEETVGSWKNSFLRNEAGTSLNTTLDGLEKFSIYANNSEGCREYIGINTYSGSVQGLVKPVLKGDGDVRSRSLMVTDTTASPYFSGSNDYTNTIKTQFPMRVMNIDAGNGLTYTKYQFDSMGMRGTELTNAKYSNNVSPDIAYFSYEGDVPVAMNYSNNVNKQVIDAFNTLGNNTRLDGNPAAPNGDHRGFFPFDNGGTGRDYGFGMRLDMDFNLTADGNVYSTNDNGEYVPCGEPMKFNFEGDDDVWVFVDGKLALDLGGDHGNAKGSITFSLDGNGPFAYVDDGAVTLKSNPQYGQTEVEGSADKTTLIKDTVFNEADDFTNDAKTAYNSKKKHTLTVFYMERGLVESNLFLEFSVSPLPEDNKVTVEKKVDYSGIDGDSVKGRVEAFFNSSKYGFTVKDADTTEQKQLGHNESVSYSNVFGNGKKVTVTEAVPDSDKYTYDTSYTVTDNYRKDVEKAAAADYTVASADGTSASFDFKSASADKNKVNDFTATFVNKVVLGSVGVKKEVPNSATDNSAFDFDYYVQLPNETKYPDKKDGTLTCIANSGNAKTLDLPVGSKVKFVENMTDAQKKVYTADKASFELTVGQNATIETVKNTINSDNAVINAQKLLDGKASSVEFDFALTKVENGAKTNEKLTAKNGKNGAVSFTLEDLQLKETYTYLLEETSKSNEDYTCDSTKYLVEVNAATSPVTVKYFTVKGELEKDSEVAAADVMFKNTSKEKFGDVKVIKKDENGKALPDATIAIAKAVKTDDVWVPAEDADIQTDRTDENGEITFSHLTPGDYVVYETQSASGHELLGEYVYVSVTENNVAEVTINDPATRKMPRTGGIGAFVMIVFGIALIALGIYILRPSKKAKEKTKSGN